MVRRCEGSLDCYIHIQLSSVRASLIGRIDMNTLVTHTNPVSVRREGLGKVDFRKGHMAQ